MSNSPPAKINYNTLSSSFKDREHSAIVHALQQVISGETSIEDSSNIPHVPRIVFSDEAAITSRYEDSANSSTTTNVGKKYKGVRQRKSGKWCAEIRDPVEGKNLWIGTFGTAEEAARAFDMKQIEFRKDKAKTNFPLSEYSELFSSQTSEVQKITKVGSSNAEHEQKHEQEQDEVNPYSWIFEDKDDEYQLPEWKIVDTP